MCAVLMLLFGEIGTDSAVLRGIGFAREVLKSADGGAEEE